MRRRVLVFGQPYTIEIVQNSKTNCSAVGEYMGERQVTTGRTPNDAASQWQVWAQSKGS
jgi:hypothetical protein